MEYSIHKLAEMAGVTTRTLRHYDQIGLLKPLRTASTGYRIYGPAQVNRLQQILFYRELDLPLEEIRCLLERPGFDRKAALTGHLEALRARRQRLDTLIDTVEKSILAEKGSITMQDKEKFEGFKQGLIDENEAVYGTETREKYGAEAMERFNAHFRGLTARQYEESQTLSAELEEVLRRALAEGDALGELSRTAFALHRRWLCVVAPQYSAEYHRALAELYEADERFRAHYDRVGEGATEFLCAAIRAQT